MSPAFLLFVLLAEILGTIGGFGSSVFFVPLGSFYFEFHAVLGLTALFHLASNISKIMLFRHGVNKFLLYYLGIPSVITVIIAGYLSVYVNGKILELILGIFLVAMSLILLLNPNLKISTGKKESLAGGMLSGFSAGLLGTGGAIRGLTMAAFDLEKSVFIATSALIDFMVDLSRTVIYYKNGFIQTQDFKYVPLLLIAAFAGTYIGKLCLKHISQERFKKISLFLILIIGFIMMLKSAIYWLTKN